MTTTKELADRIRTSRYCNDEDNEVADRLLELEAEVKRLTEAHDWQYKMAGERLRRIEKLDAENTKLHEKLDALLVHCSDGECMTCGEIICDHKDPMHFNHDGCPSCTALGENE